MLVYHSIVFSVDNIVYSLFQRLYLCLLIKVLTLQQKLMAANQIYITWKKRILKFYFFSFLVKISGFSVLTYDEEHGLF